MSKHEGITYSRQDQFCVEEDLRCGVLDIDISDTSVKAVHLHCSRASALIGEFIFADSIKAEIIADAIRCFEKLCTGRKAELNLMEGRMLTVACVLLCQDSNEEEGQDSGRLWQTILDGLQIKKVSQKTGCSEQTARNRLCTLLEDPDNIRFFTENGHRYYNTLQLHALSPVWSIYNLFDILYSFYRKNLECCYDVGSNVAIMFTASICKRWNQENDNDSLHIKSSQVSSGLRELFVLRPRYMAAVCDALLERIDHIVQGDFTILDDMNRWDILLREWYIKKSEYEKTQMHTERKAAVKRKVVDAKEKIHSEYRFENNRLILCLPGIRLPEITERPTVELYQNGKKIYEHKLSVFGDDMLLSTRPLDITLDSIAEINWNKTFYLSIRIVSGNNEIYNSEQELFRKYFCFSPAGNETRFVRCNQALRFITGNSCSIEIDDPEENWIEDSAPYRSIRLWTESIQGIKLDDREILHESAEKQHIWAYMTPESVDDINARIEGNPVAIYCEIPTLHIALSNKNDAKNYQLIVDGITTPLHGCTWDNGKFKTILPAIHEKISTVQIKDFERGEIIFERKYLTIPNYSIGFDRPYYLDKECKAIVTVKSSDNIQKFSVSLSPGEDAVAWDWNHIRFEAQVPRLRVELGGKNAFYLPEMVWHKDEKIRNSFLMVQAPCGVKYSVFFGGLQLNPNHMGHYEIGTEIINNTNIADSAPLGLLVQCGEEHEEILLTDIRFLETFLSNPVIQDGKKILWRPFEGGFIGEDGVTHFRIDLENSIQKEPFTYSLKMKNDVIEKNFDCKPGHYQYTLWLTERKRGFTKLPDIGLVNGEIIIEESPQERFQNKHIILTHVWYSDPVSQKIVCTKMQRDCAVIEDIIFEGHLNEKKTAPYYSGIMTFRTTRGWSKFCAQDTDEFVKLNPVYFIIQHGYIYVYSDADMTIDDQLMLNLKNRQQFGNVRLFSRKNELTSREQIRYLGFAEKFQYIEREN